MGDGHCAAQAEVIYVKYAPTCDVSPTAGDGSLNSPYCAVNANSKSRLSATRNVFVVRGSIGDRILLEAPSTFGIHLVGQQGAEVGTITGGVLTVTSGNVFVRDITITGGGTSDGIRLSGAETSLSLSNCTVQNNGAIGIAASSGTTLRLDGCTVKDNLRGGILVDGAAFEIQNTKIVGNGPGQSGATAWGGLLILNPPPTGPAAIRKTSVTTNKAPGIACTTAIAGTAVSATGNSLFDVAESCGFSSCGVPGPNCGAP